MESAEYRPDRPSLVPCRLKIERAKFHLDELEPKLRAYSESEPYRISEDPDKEDDWNVVRITEVRSRPDPRWGVEVGELVHNLRSSLDNLVWQLVLVNGQEPGNHNQFPIYWDRTKPPSRATLPALRKLRGATRIDDMLFGVHRDHVAVIKDLQPYLGLHMHRDHRTALAWLAELNNIDKHRFVYPTLGVRQGGKAMFQQVAGPVPSDIDLQFMKGPIYPGAELFRWRVRGGTDETEIGVQSNLPFDIAFGHENITLSRLDWLTERIGQIIERFDPAFPTEPDEPDSHDSAS